MFEAGSILRSYEPRDPDALHDIRVDARRRSALLKALRPFASKRKLRGIRKGLARLLDSSSAARDEQVRCARLQLKPPPPFDSRRFRRARARAERRALELAELVARVPRSELDRALSRAVRRQSRRLRRRLFAYAEGARALHRARLRIKLARYLVDAMPRPPALLQAALRRAQSELGDLRDDQLALGSLAEAAELDVARRFTLERELKRRIERANAGLPRLAAGLSRELERCDSRL